MRKTLTVIFTVCALALVSQPAGAQMSDAAVIAYVESGMATGKAQTDMAKELAASGVTKAQAERIKAKSVMAELEHLAITVEIPEMVQLMKHTVPEFISKNSEYEKYDIKK